MFNLFKARRSFRTLSAALVALAVLVSVGACSAETPKAEAQKDLTVEEASVLFKTLVPDAEILEVRRSEVKGLWEVVLTNRGQKKIAYIDDARENLLDGRIIDFATKTDLTRNRYDELNRVDFASLDLSRDLVMGSATAAHKVVVFDDPD